MGKQEQITNKR